MIFLLVFAVLVAGCAPHAKAPNSPTICTNGASLLNGPDMGLFDNSDQTAFSLNLRAAQLETIIVDYGCVFQFYSLQFLTDSMPMLTVYVSSDREGPWQLVELSQPIALNHYITYQTFFTAQYVKLELLSNTDRTLSIWDLEAAATQLR